MATKKRIKKAPAKGAGSKKSAGVPLHVSPEAFKKVAQSQRTLLHELAEKIERGEAITEPLAQIFAAGAIRAFADAIPDAPKRGRGRPAKFAAGDAALLAMAYRVAGRTEEDAIADAALAHGVREETMRSAYRLHKDGTSSVMAAFGMKPARSKK